MQNKKENFTSKRLLTIGELSEWLNCSPSTIYSYVSKRTIPFQKINGLLRFVQQDIEEWIDKQQEEIKSKESHFEINKNQIEKDQVDLIVNDAIDSTLNSV